MAVESRKSSYNDLPSLNSNLRLNLSASSSPSSGRKNKEEWSPKSSRKYRSKEEEPRRKQQLEAYQGWVNSQLKKLPGARYIEDLQEDMRDGVALIQLVHVVAGDILTVNENPTSHAEMRENVDRFLHFMAAKRIRMHRTTAKDIVDGNLKAIMRLILALAAHFKPASVKQAIPLSSSGTKLVRKPSAAAAAQEAAAALADARGANASAGLLMRSRHRHRPSSPPTTQSDSGLSLKNLTPKSKAAVAKRSKDLAERFVDGRTDSSGNTSGTATPSRSERSESPSSLDDDQSEDGLSRNSWSHHSRQSSTSTWSEFSDEQERIVEDIKDTKGRLLELQELLLSGRLPCEGEEEENVETEEDIIESSSILEQITILHARLDQRNAEYDKLKTELNNCREECLNLHGVRSGLEARHLEQDQIIMQLKAEVLRLNFSQDSSNGLITDLRKELKDRENEIAHMRSELSKRDRLVERQRSELEHVLKRSDSKDSAEGDISYSKARHQDGATKALRHQIKELQHRLDVAGETESDLSSRLHSQHHKMSSLEERVLHMTPVDTQRRPSTGGLPLTEEVESIKETLDRLRQSFNRHDPQIQTLEALEQSIVSIVDRATASADYPKHAKALNGLDCPDLVPEKSLPRKSHDPISSRRGGEIASSSTKILYFTERTVTPFLSSLPKRLGEITLGDFKKMFDRTGSYRFHFKALDPEFGTVKEEVVNNEDIIPGWEGKIVAWVEEDTGQKTSL